MPWCALLQHRWIRNYPERFSCWRSDLTGCSHPTSLPSLAEPPCCCADDGDALLAAERHVAGGFWLQLNAWPCFTPERPRFHTCILLLPTYPAMLLPHVHRLCKEGWQQGGPVIIALWECRADCPLRPACCTPCLVCKLPSSRSFAISQGPSWAGVNSDGSWRLLHQFAQEFYRPVLVRYGSVALLARCDA
jgi:hypothetical protein